MPVIRPVLRYAATVAVVVLGGAGPSAVLPATAAGETCLGQPATIVGADTDGTVVQGTDGPDVIWAPAVNSGRVRAGAGNDLICIVKGSGLSQAETPLVVDAGAGDDQVAVSDGVGVTVHRLGAGADTLTSGDGHETVIAGVGIQHTRADYADTDRDVVSTGAGYDTVTSGMSGHPNDDQVSLGAGDDDTWVSGSTGGAALVDGGDGHDRLFPFRLQPGRLVVDNVAGRAGVDNVAVFGFAGLDAFFLGEVANPAVTFLGSAADETVSDETHAPLAGHVVRRYLMGAGDDFVDSWVPAGGAIDGGEGRDTVFWSGCDSAVARLSSRMVCSKGTAEHTSRVRGFEVADLAVKRAGLLVGTGDDDTLSIWARRGTVRGRGGADVIEVDPDVSRKHYTLRGGRGPDMLSGQSAADRIFGGRGSDRLRGYGGDDRLVGGPGHDRLDGGRGRDRCTGERTRRCELP